MKLNTLTVAVMLPLLAACSDAAGPNDARRVTVRFTAGGSASVNRSLGASLSLTAATGPITLTGTNGTLVLQDIRLIVSELELEREGVQCEGTGEHDGCEEFEGGPYLVSLLDGGAADVVTTLVPAGTYSELEIEVENLEPEDDDPAAERQALQDILTKVRQTYPHFPGEASMVVQGTFAATGATPQPFTVYFDAEIEMEKEFAAGFKVPEDAAVVVDLNPASWFQKGTLVTNLLAFNGKTVEFRAEFESGVKVDKDSH